MVEGARADLVQAAERGALVQAAALDVQAREEEPVYPVQEAERDAQGAAERARSGR
jgi:hypothetical protein